jgi:ribonuclease T1
MIARALRFVVLSGLLFLVLYIKYQGGSPAGDGRSTVVASQPGDVSASVQGVPKKALDVLQIVRNTGQPPPGYVGGTVFQNREGRLPESGDYREFDIDPHEGHRNAERIVVDWNTKQAWYTGDHYQTFIPLP